MRELLLELGGAIGLVGLSIVVALIVTVVPGDLTGPALVAGLVVLLLSRIARRVLASGTNEGSR